jgi:wyosine [tRNA(Phe)-imidazoG37] synthetase (radical SAM superfamily)
MSIIYGPVSSWRLGRSLGIDLVNAKRKVCSFSCVYCQLGETRQFAIEPRQLISLEQLTREIRQLGHVEADYITFSGTGEPTLASNLGEAIEFVKSALDLPVAVLTNSSLMFREDVREQLGLADTVVAKLDVPNEELLGVVNRPSPGLRFDEIKNGVVLFRDKYRGKLALQIMFIRANKDYAREIAVLARQISPDEVQINTPLRPCAVTPLPPESLAEIQSQFANLRNVVSVYEAPKPRVMPLDLAETLRRRPKL